MSLLQFLILITSFVFLLVIGDLYARKKFNLIHFLIFFGGTLSIVIFIFRPDLLSRFGGVFGLARGADLIVYIAIILLVFVYFLLINQQTKTNYQLTRLCSSQALDSFVNSEQFERLSREARLDRSNIGFLMRAYNEAATIGVVIDEVINSGYSKIMIVDDGSTDATYSIIRRKQIEYPNQHIYVVRHLINRGGGAANKTLFECVTMRDKYRGVDRWVTLDADGQMDIADIHKFVPYTNDDYNYDILLGSRFVEGGSTSGISRFRQFMIRLAKLITYVFSGVWMTDPFNGYRMIRSGVIDQIQLTSDNLTYATELIAHIKRNHLKYREVGVEIRYNDYLLFKHKPNLLKSIRIALDFVYKHVFYR